MACETKDDNPGGLVPNDGGDNNNNNEERQQEEEMTKQKLAEEIAAIERELERKRLEEEIKRMEEMIATHKSMNLVKSQEITPKPYTLTEPMENPPEPMLERESSSLLPSQTVDDRGERVVRIGTESSLAIEGLEREQNIAENDLVSQTDDNEDEDEYEEEIYIEDDDETIEEIIDEDEDEFEIYEEEEYIDEEMYDEIEYIDDDEEDEGYEDFGGDESLISGNDSFMIPGNDPFVPHTLARNFLPPPPSNHFDALKSAAKSRNESSVDDGYEDFGGQESFMINGNDSFTPTTSAGGRTAAAVGGAPNLFDALKSAAISRQDRLEESQGELIFQDHKPVINEEKLNKPPDAFDLSMAVSKKAQEREERLAQGGEKKMTKIKPKSEYKQDFKSICLEAAELGRLTRLNEHIIETEAVEKTPEEEWRSKGLLAIQWRTQHMSVIHEAARAGAASKLPERVTSNYESEAEEGEYDETSATTKRISQRMKELLQMSKEVGGGQEKIDKLIMGRKEENAHRTNQHDGPAKIIRPRVFYEAADISQVKLPRRKAPTVDPQKNLELIQEKFKGTYVAERPLSNISNEVAERAWARRTRLDRPGAMPRVQEICNCPYCIDPSPFQTYAYKELDKKRKADGYVSPDSDEERRQAREKRRQERRKGRPQRNRDRGVGRQSSGSSDGADSSDRLPRRGRQTRQLSDDSLSSTEFSHILGPPPAARPPRPPRPPAAADASEPPVCLPTHESPEALPPPRRRGTGRIGVAAQTLTGRAQPGKIGATAKQMEEQRIYASLEAKAKPEPVVVGSDRNDRQRKTRRVVRRRGVAPTDQEQPKTDRNSRRIASADANKSTPGADKKLVRRQRRRKDGETTTTKREGNTTTTTITTGTGEGPATTRTRVITKADGTRVVQKVVTRAPQKVVTRKVVRKGPNGEQVVQSVNTVEPTKSSNMNKQTTSRPLKTVTRPGLTTNVNQTPSGASEGSAPSVTVTREGQARVTTRTITRERKPQQAKRGIFGRKSKA